jgi:DNA (cytosine-5)-methyltransferase 1
VDLITAGYPCQPESTAGKRLGHEDERWLWADIWRVICDVAPRYVFVENVAAHLSGTWGRVLGDLAAGRWRVEWDCVPSAAVGAPHLRDRLFALAARVMAEQPTANTFAGSWQQQSPEPGCSAASGPGNAMLASSGLLPTPLRGDSKRAGSHGYSTASGRHGGRTLTDCTAGPASGRDERRLNPVFVEWMLGLPAGWTA